MSFFKRIYFAIRFISYHLSHRFLSFIFYFQWYHQLGQIVPNLNWINQMIVLALIRYVLFDFTLFCFVLYLFLNLYATNPTQSAQFNGFLRIDVVVCQNPIARRIFYFIIFSLSLNRFASIVVLYVVCVYVLICLVCVCVNMNV